MKVGRICTCGIVCLSMGWLAGCSSGEGYPDGVAPAVETPRAFFETPTPFIPPTVEPTDTPEMTIRSIKAGWGFTLALGSDGGVKCWGAGYLCDGSTVHKSTPVDKQELAGGVAAITAGGGHACALTGEGGVKCWGSNNFGQLGNDTREESSTPMDVVGLTGGVSAIAAGSSHTCALTDGGGVKCWGENGFGQLGDGTLNLSRVPVDVSGLTSGAVAISAGGTHTCAVMAGGGVKCWGFNGDGQLGNNNTIETADRFRSTPTDVEGLTEPVVELALGGHTTCARTERGRVKCWGYRENGQLGNGVLPETQKAHTGTPVDVFGLTEGVASITVGMSTACALTAAGGVLCWGVKTGADDPAARKMSFVPVPVSGFAGGGAAVSAGDMHVCILTVTGAVKCWGANMFGQLGDGTENNSDLPVEVIGLAGLPEG